ncbi:Atu4866 domain-containing protein [Bradyrhizobium sp. Leo170]|uniref:Atu4866 domain-containing protein n=2 Tax=unclassified Bradyrhizobium TaxID=2631580 RepID=UPI0013EEC84B|nr:MULTISPECIES: Atu4866 domain-containing protein [unclassified Bradyrhizobium]MDI4231420.1 Atu4866 domain-containing protein [Bradyrhizobium sp. Arg237L]
MQRAFAAMIATTLLIAPVRAEETELKANHHPYVGLWVTQNGHIRHELLPNGRYVEARGTRERAYEGRYEVTGTHIEYWDDTGFTADGEFIDDVLHHAGMILYRR